MLLYEYSNSNNMINRDKQIHHLVQAEADLTAHRLLEVEPTLYMPSDSKLTETPESTWPEPATIM